MLQMKRIITSVCFVGKIPYQLCDITGLHTLRVDGTGLTCFPSCLESVGVQQMGSLDTPGCSTPLQRALCDFSAATNIATVGGFSAWACDNTNITLTDPCDAENAGASVWGGLTCVHNIVTEIDISTATAATLTGSFDHCLGVMFCFSHCFAHSRHDSGLIW